MLDEKTPGHLIREIKASEHTASELIEKTQKDVAEQLSSTRASKKFAKINFQLWIRIMLQMTCSVQVRVGRLFPL